MAILEAMWRGPQLSPNKPSLEGMTLLSRLILGPTVCWQNDAPDWHSAVSPPRIVGGISGTNQPPLKTVCYFRFLSTNIGYYASNASLNGIHCGRGAGRGQLRFLRFQVIGMCQCSAHLTQVPLTGEEAGGIGRRRPSRAAQPPRLMMRL